MPVALSSTSSLKPLPKSASHQNTFIPSPTVISATSNTNYIRPQGLNNSNAITLQRSKPIPITSGTSSIPHMSASASSLSATTQAIHSNSYSKLKSSNFKFMHNKVNSSSSASSVATQSPAIETKTYSPKEKTKSSPTNNQQQQPVSLIKKSFSGSFNNPNSNSNNPTPRHPRQNSVTTAGTPTATSTSNTGSSHQNIVTIKSNLIPTYKSRIMPPSPVTRPNNHYISSREVTATSQLSQQRVVEATAASLCSSIEVKKPMVSNISSSSVRSEIPTLATRSRILVETTNVDAGELDSQRRISSSNRKSNFSGSSLNSSGQMSSFNSTSSCAMNTSSNMSHISSGSSLIKACKPPSVDSRNNTTTAALIKRSLVNAPTTPIMSTPPSRGSSALSSTSTSPTSFPSPASSPCLANTCRNNQQVIDFFFFFSFKIYSFIFALVGEYKY